MSHAWLGRLVEICRPPTGVDALLRAWLADDRTAADAWGDFERRADLDHLPGPEMCLVGLVSKRLPTIAPTSTLRGRVGGIERANWSRAQLAVGEAAAAADVLTTQDIPVLIVGNAARCATGDAIGRGRRIDRVDCCVRPADIPRAHDLLLADGWQFAAPHAVARSRAQSAHACRFVRGRFGALEVRKSPFPHPVPDAIAAVAVWQRAKPGTLGDASVLLPSATDALAITVADGMRRSCYTGLWLADVAMATGDGIDWQLFEEESGRQGLDAAAFYSLLYVNDRLARAVPKETLGRLERSAARRSVRTAILLAEYRCGARASGMSRSVAGIVQRLRRFVSRQPASASLDTGHEHRKDWRGRTVSRNHGH